jgi:hypothetical protein
MAINIPAAPTLNQTYTFNGRTWTYNNVGWQATGSTGLTVYTKTNFTATAAQTSFSATYTVGFVDVYYNGSKLSTSEYTATTGSTVVLGTACALNDIVETIAWTISSSFNPSLGSASATSLAIGGATIGSNALAVTGTIAGSGNLTLTNTTAVGFTAAATANSISPYLVLASNNRTWWTAAIDTGADASFKIGTGATIGSNTCLSIAPTTQAVTLSGNLNFAAGTNGIVFNNSSATVNSTLNDYEVGTFTPTFNATTIAGSYTVNGYYTKVGAMVFISVSVANATTFTSTSNSSSMLGLPFTVAGSYTGLVATNNYIENFGVGAIYSGTTAYLPSINQTGVTKTYIFSGTYRANF